MINLVRHPQSIRGIFYSYCENVTCHHGYSHIVRNKNNFLCILWSVVTFGLLGVLSCFTLDAFTEFAQRKVLTQVKVAVLGELARISVSVDLFSVSVCLSLFLSHDLTTQILIAIKDGCLAVIFEWAIVAF